MGFWRTGTVRAVKFYSAPFVKFGLDIISYILLLSLYCYVLLHFRAGKCRLLTNRQISFWHVSLSNVHPEAKGLACPNLPLRVF